MSANDAVITAENITKIYKLYDRPVDRMKEALNPFGKKYHKEHYALKEVNLEIKNGETVGIIGANGSGKSTLLKIITGVLTPSSGSLQVKGRVSSLLELGAGLNPELSGYDNIYFMGTIMGFSKREIDRKVDEIVAFVDIGEYIHQPVKTYSSGMMARLGFGVAVHIEPDILIIDEALSVGDIRFQQRAIRKMKELMGKAKALLFVSHSLDMVRSLCERAIWINQGNVIGDGSSKEVTADFYSFMSTGKLKQTAETARIAPVAAPAMYEKLQWLDVSKCDCTGDGGVSLLGVALYTEDNVNYNGKELEGGEELCFYMKVYVRDRMEFPSFGFNIKNELGINVFGVGSSHFSYTSDPFGPDTVKIIKIKFSLPHLLNGLYSLSTAIIDFVNGVEKVKKSFVFDALILKVRSFDVKQNHASLIIPEHAEFDVI